MVRVLALNVVVLSALQEPPENFETGRGLYELHPSFGDQPVLQIDDCDTGEVLDFAIQPVFTVPFNATVRPIEADVDWCDVHSRWDINLQIEHELLLDVAAQLWSHAA